MLPVDGVCPTLMRCLAKEIGADEALAFCVEITFNQVSRLEALSYTYCQVLAEVLQQQLRLDDPSAAQRKSFLRQASPFPCSC